MASVTTPADEPKRGLFSGFGGKKDDDQAQKPAVMPGGVQGTPIQTQKKAGTRQRTQSDELMTLDTKLDILGGVLIVTALIIMLSFFSGTPGSLTRQLLRGLYQGFGWGAYFVPVVLGAIGVWLLWDHFGDQLPEVQPIRIIGVAIVYLSVLTLMHAILVAVQPVGYVYVDPALSNPAYPGFTPELMWQNAAACPARPQEYLDRGWILQQAYLDSYQVAQCGYGGGYLGAWIQTSIAGLLGTLPLFLIMLVTLFGGTLMTLKMPLDVALNKVGDRFRKARGKPAPATGKPVIAGASSAPVSPTVPVSGRPSIVTGKGPESASVATASPGTPSAVPPSTPVPVGTGLPAAAGSTGFQSGDGKPSRLEVPPRPGTTDRSNEPSVNNRPQMQAGVTQRPTTVPGVNLTSDAASSAAASSQAPAARPGQYTPPARQQPVTPSEQAAYRSPGSQAAPDANASPLRQRDESQAENRQPAQPSHARPTVDRPYNSDQQRPVPPSDGPNPGQSTRPQGSVVPASGSGTSFRQDMPAQRPPEAGEQNTFRRTTGLPERGQPPVPASSTPVMRPQSLPGDSAATSNQRPSPGNDEEEAPSVRSALPPSQRQVVPSQSFGQYRPAPKPSSNINDEEESELDDQDAEDDKEDFNQARPFSMSSDGNASPPVKPNAAVSSAVSAQQMPPSSVTRPVAPQQTAAGAPQGTSQSSFSASSQSHRTEPERVSEVARVIRPGTGDPVKWDLPAMSLLQPSVMKTMSEKDLKYKASVIEQTLSSFGAPGRVVEVNCGPVITQFGVEPDYLDGRAGKKIKVKVGKIAALADDLALVLAAPTIRIEAPVPGKGYVGIEVPNDTPSIVGLRDAMDTKEFKDLDSPLKLALGHDVSGQPRVADLTRMPHLLIAGTTGSGKSVCVNGIICTMLMENTPEQLKMIMVDPKRVELTGYNGIPHLLTPVVTELERILSVLKWIQREMEDRYHRFALVGARNIVDFNVRVADGRVKDEDKMPYYLVIIDELADLMMQAPDETERLLTRLAQMARATGIHLIISTQRPSVDVVTGIIKANFPARIAFAVATGVDSRVIIDMPGAEKLLGSGDMLFQAPDAPLPVRLQGVYTSDKEIEQIVNFWREQAAQKGQQSQTRSLEQLFKSAPEGFSSPVATSGLKQSAMFTSEESEGDDLFDEAVDLVRDIGKASTSLLQRHMRIGYTRAARLIDLMEEKKVIGSHEGGSKPRVVFDEEGNLIEGSDVL